MKRSAFGYSLFYVGVVIFFTSCASGGNKKTTAADSTAAADTAAKTQAVNTIVTTPQNVQVVTHKVADFTKWLAAYEGHDSARLAHGLHSFVIARGFEDSNMVMVVTKVDDTARAKAFEKEPSLKMAMKKGGVLGVPTISIYTETWQDTAKIETTLRSVAMFTVKDWDAWQKGFEAGKQERLDNGITDRVVGHELDDDKKVSVVTAISDTAKAFAYFKSAALKNRKAASGVVGESRRFIFYIVKVY
jgi:heme-degrading monooxygenase HmoA